MPDIAVVDYGMGNLRSVAKALAHVAPQRAIVVTADPAVDRPRRAGRAAGPERDARLHAQASTRADCATPSLEATRTRPFLGICLGLQMLFEMSEEGPTAGLSRPARPRRALS